MPDGPALVLLVIGGIMTVFTFIGVTWKLMRFVFKVDRAMPTILNIAGQFENNGGSTLKDKIEEIAERAENLGVENRLTVKIAEDSRLIAKTNAAIVNELSKTQGEDIAHIKEYMHTKMHDINNSLAGVAGLAALAEKRAARIEERLDKLFPLVVRHRGDFSDNEGQSAS